MKIHIYNEHTIKEMIKKGEPIMAAITLDGENAYAGYADDCVEHRVLLSKFNRKEADEYFRIVFDHDAADWIFICPVDYKSIEDKSLRLKEYYTDGMKAISTFLADIGCLVDIQIPERYRHHMK